MRAGSSANALAESGIIPDAEVDKIRKGRGKLDQANDCVDLAALFRKYETAIRGKTPITTAEVDEAAAVGSTLQTILKPRHLRRERPTSEEVAAAEEARDRLWSLLVKRYDRLWRVGAWIWGRDVDAVVPPLQSRVLGPRKEETQGEGEGGDK